MNRPSRTLTLATLALATAATLATLPARAQGTEEQQEACAPDAFKFCQKTIPDIPKTTACMKAHVADLSPRCRAAFDSAMGGGGAQAPASVAGEAAPARPAADFVPAPDAGGGYAAQIRSYCRQGLIDPFTCRNTLSLLGGAE